MKFIAMLQPLYFNTKIHCEYFFCWERYFADMLQTCCRASLKEPFWKMGTLSVKVRAYPHEIKTNNMNFKYAVVLPL